MVSWTKAKIKGQELAARPGTACARLAAVSGSNCNEHREKVDSTDPYCDIHTLILFHHILRLGVGPGQLFRTAWTSHSQKLSFNQLLWRARKKLSFLEPRGPRPPKNSALISSFWRT
jgi:hypothetical protein